MTDSGAQFCAFRGEVPVRAVLKASIFERLMMGDRLCDKFFVGSEMPGGRVANHVRARRRRGQGPRELGQQAKRRQGQQQVASSLWPWERTGQAQPAPQPQLQQRRGFGLAASTRRTLQKRRLTEDTNALNLP